MKLLNFPEENVPEEFYIFKRGGWHAEWQFEKTRHLVSSAYGELGFETPEQENFVKKYENGNLNYLPFDFKNPEKMDVQSVSPWRHKLINNLRIEYDCEYARKGINSLYPSRLSCIYAFADEKTCNRAATERGWNIHSVAKFTLENNQFSRVVKTNMLIFDLARKAYTQGICNNDLSMLIWKSYWNCNEVTVDLPHHINLGKREYIQSGILKEYLIEGSLKRID